MSYVIDYCCATAIAKLNLHLAHAVLMESAALGLPLERAKRNLDQAHDDYRHNSPIFAAGIDIRGNVICDMYSNDPGVANFAEAQELRNHANYLEELVDLSNAQRSGRLVRETIQ